MKVALGVLRIPRGDFWDMSFGEFWPIYNQHFGKVAKPMNRKRYDEMKAW